MEIFLRKVADYTDLGSACFGLKFILTWSWELT